MTSRKSQSYISGKKNQTRRNGRRSRIVYTIFLFVFGSGHKPRCRRRRWTVQEAATRHSAREDTIIFIIITIIIIYCRRARARLVPSGFRVLGGTDVGRDATGAAADSVRRFADRIARPSRTEPERYVPAQLRRAASARFGSDRAMTRGWYLCVHSRPFQNHIPTGYVFSAAPRRPVTHHRHRGYRHPVRCSYSDGKETTRTPDRVGQNAR